MTPIFEIQAAPEAVVRVGVGELSEPLTPQAPEA